jgi:hypothetical protein
MNEQIPEKFDWVEARQNCSLGSEFIAIKADAEKNVERKNQLLKESSPSGKIFPFACVAYREDAFQILRDFGGDPYAQFDPPKAIVFELNQGSIQIKRFEGVKDTLLFEIKVGLDSRGKCMLKVGEESLYRWQVLHRALEGLFFDRSRQ